MQYLVLNRQNLMLSTTTHTCSSYSDMANISIVNLKQWFIHVYKQMIWAFASFICEDIPFSNCAFAPSLVRREQEIKFVWEKEGRKRWEGYSITLTHTHTHNGQAMTNLNFQTNNNSHFPGASTENLTKSPPLPSSPSQYGKIPFIWCKFSRQHMIYKLLHVLTQEF